MLFSAILGSTIFDTIQIIIESLLFVLLICGLIKIKLSAKDLGLLFLFITTFIIGFVNEDFKKIALIFKIYGLCVLTFVYFQKVCFYPKQLISIIHLINSFLIVHQYITGHFIIPSAWFFGQYQDYANSRPVGLFLTPHASSFFIAIYSLYLIFLLRKYLNGLFFFILNLMTGSLTSIVAFFAQIFNNIFFALNNKFKILKILFGFRTQITIVAILILFLSIFKEQFLEFMKLIPYSRSNSLEIILNQFYDYRFFSDIFKLYPRDYQSYLIAQENIFADYANEIGIVRVFVECGFLFGSCLIIVLVRDLKFYSIFIFVSLLHYSFVINMPFMLYLMLQYDHNINKLKFFNHNIK